MFKDYYAILDISSDSSFEYIKTAFRKKSFQWHPDRNHDDKATQKMQDINEAYLILKDKEARERYNREYKRYNDFIERKKEEQQQDSENSGINKQRYRGWTEKYHFDDETLKKWMQNARQQAKELLKQTGKEIEKGTNAAAKEMGQYLLMFIVVGIFLFIIFKACSN